MAFVGNVNGPRESDIINSLGPSYFGCSPTALEEDIAHHLYAEQRGEVVPVHVDGTGRPYIVFSSPEPKTPQRYYLDEYGHRLEGDIQTFTDIERTYWASGQPPVPAPISK